MNLIYDATHQHPVSMRTSPETGWLESAAVWFCLISAVKRDLRRRGGWWCGGCISTLHGTETMLHATHTHLLFFFFDWQYEWRGGGNRVEMLGIFFYSLLVGRVRGRDVEGFCSCRHRRKTSKLTYTGDALPRPAQPWFVRAHHCRPIDERASAESLLDHQDGKRWDKSKQRTLRGLRLFSGARRKRVGLDDCHPSG